MEEGGGRRVEEGIERARKKWVFVQQNPNTKTGGVWREIGGEGWEWWKKKEKKNLI